VCGSDALPPWEHTPRYSAPDWLGAHACPHEWWRAAAQASHIPMSQHASQDRFPRFSRGAGRWRVSLALVVASLLWGSLSPAAKPVLAVTGPMQVTFCRVLLAFIALAVVILLRSGPGLLVQLL